MTSITLRNLLLPLLAVSAVLAVKTHQVGFASAVLYVLAMLALAAPVVAALWWFERRRQRQWVAMKQRLLAEDSLI